jgi:nucleoside phosphorylase
VTRVLVLTAIDLEAHRLARRLRLRRVAGHAWAHYRGGPLEIVSIGIGGGRLVERTARCPRPTLVVSAGTCAALSPDLRAGDLVVPEIVIAPGGIRYPTAVVPGLDRAGALLTVEGVAARPADKALLGSQSGAVAADMESSVVVEWARGQRLPVAVVRGVVDTARDAVPPDVAGLVESGGRVSLARVLRAALARPLVVADAWALGRATAAALRAVASALDRIAPPIPRVRRAAATPAPGPEPEGPDG